MSDKNSRPDETVRASSSADPSPRERSEDSVDHGSSAVASVERAARAAEIKDAARIEAENPLGWRQFRSYPLGRCGRRVEPKGGAE